ncbi:MULTISPECIES: hypothetical protein [Rhizobium]|uniref:hypothetical protein n=1 Tax=Rhizobium TaxID=379 RepID=UPI000462D126|nr:MULTISPECIES: hypothetical protein [Rhizobium]MCS0459985.1 hypothetical protein [Rhizobium favelukesii]UFS82300.1 hypothetical protein LPB79_29185 [Rhizobium sp. T136]
MRLASFMSKACSPRKGNQSGNLGGGSGLLERCAGLEKLLRQVTYSEADKARMAMLIIDQAWRRAIRALSSFFAATGAIF